MLYIGVIDQAYKVKTVGYWQSSSRPIKPPQKELGQYQALFTRTSLASKLFITLPRELYSCTTQSGIPAGARYLTLTLPTWAADQNIGFAIILPARRISQ